MGLFETNIITSSQVAYTTVRLSAFNYHCLQLTRLVQRRSLQNNAYGYLTERQRYVYKHDSIATLIDSIALLGNTIEAPDEKKTQVLSCCNLNS